MLISHTNVFKSLNLKLKVKDVEDLDENWQVKVTCQRMKKLALLG